MTSHPSTSDDGGAQCCPLCGSDAGYVVSDRANGWVQYEGDWSGSEERLSGEDGLRYSRSASVACIACKRRVPRPVARVSQSIGG